MSIMTDISYLDAHETARRSRGHEPGMKGAMDVFFVGIDQKGIGILRRDFSESLEERNNSFTERDSIQLWQWQRSHLP